MQIDITARHLSLTSAIDAYVHKKLSKTARLFDEQDLRAHVILSVEKKSQITDITFRGGKFTARAKEQSSDLYASIDLAVDKLEKQFKKQKEMSKFKRKENIKAIERKKTNILKTFSYDFDSDARNKISEVRRFDLKPMNIDEAIENMQSSNYGAYMFFNDESDKVNVLYANKDSLVLLEPNE